MDPKRIIGLSPKLRGTYIFAKFRNINGLFFVIRHVEFPNLNIAGTVDLAFSVMLQRDTSRAETIIGALPKCC